MKKILVRLFSVFAVILLVGFPIVNTSFADEETSIHPKQESVIPLSKAHAHNDYLHDRPLFDAMKNGFTSVEADVWLVDGKLLVAHERENVSFDRTLKALYLDPLRHRVKNNHGTVYSGNEHDFLLWIDIKSNGASTYRALHKLLKSNQKMLTKFVPSGVKPGAVTVIVSGDRPRSLMKNQVVRYAGYDGRMSDLGTDVSNEFMPVISDNWQEHFTWMGEGEMPKEERAKLNKMVSTAHANGRMVRFWATPDSPSDERRAVWLELLNAGVDLINSDDLDGLQEFLKTNDSSPSGPHIIWNNEQQTVERKRNNIAEKFQQLSRSTELREIKDIKLNFDVYHPQGMTKVEGLYYMSSVEIIELPEKYDSPKNGYDRSPGKGIGHLFVFNEHGELLKDIELGEGEMYHPGGIAYDGENIWVPVAEYRPNSQSIIYKVDLKTMKAKEVFRVDDHIGGVVPSRDNGKLSGVSWGSRQFYKWTEHGKQLSVKENPSHFIDYQDCEGVGQNQMICSGISVLANPTSEKPYELGGLALLDIKTSEMMSEIPVEEWSENGHVVTRNPVFIENSEQGLILYAVPDDDNASLLVYEMEN